jgi:hypothetical protein
MRGGMTRSISDAVALHHETGRESSARRCPKSVHAVSQDERNPLGEWHGHLLIHDRRRCVLFCHDLTRYVLFLPGLRAAQFNDIGRWHQELFLATLAVRGMSSPHLARLKLLLGPLRIDNQTDRSVLGSLRVAADDFRYGFLSHVANVLDLDPIAISHELNQRPCRVGRTLIWPAEAMRKLVEEAVPLVSRALSAHTLTRMLH